MVKYRKYQCKKFRRFQGKSIGFIGCYSPESEAVTVKVNALPQKPMILKRFD
jgi:hypothetical protein